MVLHARASAKVTQYNDPRRLIAHRGHAERDQCCRQTADRVPRCLGRHGLAQLAGCDAPLVQTSRAVYQGLAFKEMLSALQRRDASVHANQMGRFVGLLLFSFDF